MNSKLHTGIIILCFPLISFYSKALSAQSGILLNTDEATDSYTLLNLSSSAYLIDNCGDVLNVWNVGNPSLHSKLLPNGNLIQISNNQVREYNWEGDLLSITSHGEPTLSIEYEVVVLPNGNYLCVGRRDFSSEEFYAIGYDFITIGTPNVVDVVVELDQETGAIVWEWNISDHVIQQRDDTLPNYGILAENPQLLNMDAVATDDWTFHESFMINGMDYNPALDQIVLSVRKISEAVVIDHSTPAEEVAGHTGGNSGKGGDILYRWGNPQNYDHGTADDRMLYFQHNPNWITVGEHTGKLILYNNGLNRPDVSFEERYSSVPVIDTPVDENGDYALEDGLAFAPIEPTLYYSRFDTDTPFYSGYTSGAEYMANGNIFITEGQPGRIFEINPAGEVVWEYQIPFGGTFRTERYPTNYEAFDGQELEPVGPVPSTFSTYECVITDVEDELQDESTLLTGFYDAAYQQITMQNKADRGFYYTLYDLQGRVLVSDFSAAASKEIHADNLPSGIYLLSLSDVKNKLNNTIKILVQK